MNQAQLDSFITEHGGPLVAEKNIIYCKDGAMIRDSYIFCQPHINPPYRLKARRKYHARLLDRATKEYAKLFAALKYGAVPWRYPDSADWFYKHLGQPGKTAWSTLIRLAMIMDASRQAIAEIEKELGPPIYAE